jgi:hypothetical protein
MRLEFFQLRDFVVVQAVFVGALLLAIVIGATGRAAGRAFTSWRLRRAPARARQARRPTSRPASSRTTARTAATTAGHAPAASISGSTCVCGLAPRRSLPA